jgi:hypothetical protein
MKTIIAGSRQGIQAKHLWQAIERITWKITEVVSGGAKGADQLGESYAAQEGLPVKRFLPDWKRYRKRAGILRNQQMADYADALIALWDGESRGTKHMIEEALQRNLKVYVYRVDGAGP